jgi:ppGpp synthetase/RelA/SpoT-type nucleotidyltranferase
MILPGQFVQAYNRMYPVFERLRARCEPLLRGAAIDAGGRLSHSRIKAQESLFLKTEKNGPTDPFFETEDIFAATIVVPNELNVPKVEEGLKKGFVVVDRKAQRTRKPDEFVYDDIHMILRLNPEPGRSDPEIERLTIEVQIKTAMQAASSEISHDLVYKPPLLSWKKARLASRVRALVETVDDLLARIATEADTEEDYKPFSQRNKVIGVLTEILPDPQLPTDRRRLAIIIESYLRDCQPPISIDELATMLRNPVHATLVQAASLSPAQKIFMILIKEGSLLATAGDLTSLRGERRYVISEEMLTLYPELRAVPEERRVGFPQT